MNRLSGIADIHVHTTASDGHSSPLEVVSAAIMAQLHVIAITDHNTITGAIAARRIAQSYDIEVIVGEEVSTADGHVLALFIEREIAPGHPLAATIAEIHAQGGLCILAHPFAWITSSVGSWAQALRSGHWKIDGVETFNASLPLPSMNQRAAALTAETKQAALGGSDSHHASTVGCGVTRFPGQSAADLYAAIRAGSTQAAGTGWGSRATASYLMARAQRSMRSWPSILLGQSRPPSAASGDATIMS